MLQHNVPMMHEGMLRRCLIKLSAYLECLERDINFQSNRYSVCWADHPKLMVGFFIQKKPRAEENFYFWHEVFISKWKDPWIYTYIFPATWYNHNHLLDNVEWAWSCVSFHVRWFASCWCWMRDVIKSVPRQHCTIALPSAPLLRWVFLSGIICISGISL